MYSTFICVPKRVPIMECHSILTYLKLSIVLPPDDFSVSTKAREKVFFAFNCSHCPSPYFSF